MGTKRIIVAACVGIAAALAGCSVLASKSDYASYREVRMADRERDRVVAMHRYITDHPEGQWAPEVQAQRTEMEVAVYQGNNSTREGLEFYLQVYPDGQYAQVARPRLAALQQVAGRRQTEDVQAQHVVRQRQEAAAEARRLWVTRSVQYWARTMLSIQNWGRPLAEVARGNADFSRAFGRAPQPRCSRTECIKFYQATFGVPVPGGTRIERDLSLLLRLRMDGGNLVRAELLLPGKGFSRWYELENRELVVDEDPTSRQAAIEWALQRIIPVIREALPGAVVVQDIVPEPVDAPTVLAPEQPDPGASTAPDEEPDPAPDTQGASPAAGGTAAGTGDPNSIDALLNRAAGVDPTQPTPPQPQRQPSAPATATAEIVLPIALQGFSARGVRVVAFAAADEDTGPAYDGVFIEQIR